MSTDIIDLTFTAQQTQKSLEKPHEVSSDVDNDNTAKKAVCQECGQEPYQYQCPRCSFRSCSLTCCRAHKKRTQCNGKRDRTAFIPLSRMTDASLYDDYHFLEDVISKVDSSKRQAKQQQYSTGNDRGKSKKRVRVENLTNIGNVDDNVHPLMAASKATLPAFMTSAASATPLTTDLDDAPNKLRNFAKRAHDQSIRVLFMPTGMQRHQANKSYIQHNTLYWTVEWCLHDQTAQDGKDDTMVKTTTCCETCVLTVAVKKAFPDIDIAQYVLVMKKIPCPSNKPQYIHVSIDSTLQDTLRGQTVREFPTIDIVHASRSSEFPLLLQAV